MRAASRLLLGLAPLAGAVAPPSVASTDDGILKGISYGPVPTKRLGEGPVDDDFMTSAYEPLWGDSGRGDLSVMRAIGANTVRLYGNDPRFDHSGFLDTAQKHGIHVIPGMSNYPYTDAPNACRSTGWDCYEQLKAQYAANLQKGFQKDGSYHPALSHVIIINEPDYKAPGLGQPKLFCKAIISAFDGMLDAEREAGIAGASVKFTATFSFGVCSACSRYNSKPALGQMYDLRAAMLDPSIVGYTPKNDLATAYRERFVQSFNTPSPAFVIKGEFLQYYKQEFQEPFFIGEYHAPMTAQAEDLASIMQLAGDGSNLFLGISYFEFQVAYWKGGSEMAFGMLGLGDMEITKFSAFGRDYSAWCLNGSVPDPHGKQPGATIVQAVVDAFGGAGLDWNSLCVFDPNKVPVTSDGYGHILSQRSTLQMQAFVTRVVGHMGGVVSDQNGLETFAARYSGESQPAAGGFAQLAGELGGHPDWARWDTVSAACVADRSASAATLGKAMGYACGRLSAFDCEDLPEQCNSSIWTRADYIFSTYYSEVAGGSGALENCSFDGAALCAAREAYEASSGGCVVSEDPESTAMTQDGYNVILSGGSDKVAAFIGRVLRDELHERVADEAALRRLASNSTAQLPASLPALQRLLRGVPWTCAGATQRQCPSGGGPIGTGVMVAVFISAGLAVAALLAAICVRHRRKRARMLQAPPLVPAAGSA